MNMGSKEGEPETTDLYSRSVGGEHNPLDQEAPRERSFLAEVYASIWKVTIQKCSCLMKKNAYKNLTSTY